MSGQFDNRVAFITGAARGQGRSHAIRFAEEGADILAFDLCDQVDSVEYPMSTRYDLDETVDLVKKTGRRIVAVQGDVRDFAQLKDAVAEGLSELGRIDFVLANAGILPVVGEAGQRKTAFTDAIDVMLSGVYYTVEAALPALLGNDDGGAVVITSSTAGLNSLSPAFSVRTDGMAGYHAAKHGVVGLMRYYATSLAEKNIRVNTVHPTGVATPMVLNEEFARFVSEHPESTSALENLLSVALIDASDVSEAMVYLCGRAGRFITGITLPVDAGLSVK